MKKLSVSSEKFIVRVLFWLFTAYCLPLTAHAATFYIDGNISPTSCTTYRETQRDCSGSSGVTAYKAPSNAAAAANPGDIVLWRGGTYSTPDTNPVLYNDRSGTSSSRITFRKYPGETVTATTSQDGSNTSGPFLIWFLGAHYSTLDCVDPTQFIISGGNYAVYFDGGGNNEILNCTVTMGYQQGLAFRHGENNSRAAFNRVTNNVQSNFPRGKDPNWGAGLSANGSSSNIFENNVVYFNHGEGISYNLGGSGGIVRNNISSDNWSVNLYSDGGDTVTFSGNFAYTTPDAVGLPCLNGNGQWATSGGCATGNLNFPVGIAASAEGDSSGPLNNIRVTRNVVVNGDGGFRAFHNAGVNRVYANWVIDNNTFVRSSGGIILGNCNGAMTECGTFSNLTTVNNLVIEEQFSLLQYRMVPFTAQTYKNNFFYGFDAIYINDGFNTYANGASTLGFTGQPPGQPTTNPLLVNHAAIPGRLWNSGTYGFPTGAVPISTINTNNYQLQAGSPAIDRGTVNVCVAPCTPTFTISSFNGAAPDIGALEFGGATGVASVTWTNDRGGSGSATTLTSSSWTISSIPLGVGINNLIVTYTDTAGVQTTDNLVVTYAPSFPGNTLAGSWAFDGNGIDSSGNNNTANLQGGATYGAARFGASSLALNGSTQYASVADVNSLDFTQSFTFSAWLFPTAVQNDMRAIMVKNFMIALYGSSAGYCGAGAPLLFFRPNGTAGPDYFACYPTPLPVNQWTHLAGTYNGSSLILYTNGVARTTIAATGYIEPSNLPLEIGRSQYGEYWTGRIDEARVYNWGIPLTAGSNTTPGVACTQQNYADNASNPSIIGNMNCGIVAMTTPVTVKFPASATSLKVGAAPGAVKFGQAQ